MKWKKHAPLKENQIKNEMFVPEKEKITSLFRVFLLNLSIFLPYFHYLTVFFLILVDLLNEIGYNENYKINQKL